MRPLAALLLLATLWHATLAAADVPVFLVEVDHCSGHSGAAKGTAFLVKRFQSSQTPTVLVTALHVVHGCSDVRIYQLDCKADHPEGSVVLVAQPLPSDTIETWPTMDLAAMPVLPGSQLASFTTTGEIDLRTTTLQGLINTTETKSYKVPTATNVCKRGFAQDTGTLPADIQFYFLADRDAARARQMRGDLAAKTYFLTYSGTPGPGASGAPVLLDDRVIAIHEAGYLSPSGGSWAIVFGGSFLAELASATAHLGAWPKFKEPAQVQRARMNESFLNDESRIRPGQNLFSLSLLPIAQARYFRSESEAGLAIRAGYTAHPWIVNTGIGYLKVGFTIEAAYRFGYVSQVFYGPNHQKLESQNVGLDAVYAAPGIDLRLDRLRSNLSPSLSGGFMLGPWRYIELASGHHATDTLFGFWMSLRDRIPIEQLCLSLSSRTCIHFVFGVDAAWIKTPTLDFTYTGLGGKYTTASDAYVWHAMAEVGLEW